MHSTRHNCLIFQKNVIKRRGEISSQYTILRGVYSSKRKADKDLETFKNTEYNQLSRFYNTVPTIDSGTDRVLLTVPGQSVTLVLMKIPQDVMTAVEI